MNRFNDLFFSREHRFAVGQDESSGGFYLSIPVSNRLVDYEEYYRMTDEQFADFKEDLSKARVFADQCRKRQHDYLLIVLPGSGRGAAD